MTTLTFQTSDEARAWDMYVAGVLACPEPWKAILHADAMILERRKRMAPEKVEREWITHKPGDPMPCDGSIYVQVKLRGGEFLSSRAYALSWCEIEKNLQGEIIAWRPA